MNKGSETDRKRLGQRSDKPPLVSDAIGHKDKPEGENSIISEDARNWGPKVKIGGHMPSTHSIPQVTPTYQSMTDYCTKVVLRMSPGLKDPYHPAMLQLF